MHALWLIRKPFADVARAAEPKVNLLGFLLLALPWRYILRLICKAVAEAATPSGAADIENPATSPAIGTPQPLPPAVEGRSAPGDADIMDRLAEGAIGKLQAITFAANPDRSAKPFQAHCASVVRQHMLLAQVGHFELAHALAIYGPPGSAHGVISRRKHMES